MLEDVVESNNFFFLVVFPYFAAVEKRSCSVVDHDWIVVNNIKTLINTDTRCSVWSLLGGGGFVVVNFSGVQGPCGGVQPESWESDKDQTR